jgi:phosphotransacetylase
MGPEAAKATAIVRSLQRGIEVADIVNMAAIAVVDAQEKAAAE